jgi:hypothetical protein
MDAAQQRTPKVDAGDGGISKGKVGQGLVHLVVLIRDVVVRKINRLKLAWYGPVVCEKLGIETNMQNQKSKTGINKLQQHIKPCAFPKKRVSTQ